MHLLERDVIGGSEVQVRLSPGEVELQDTIYTALRRRGVELPSRPSVYRWMLDNIAQRIVNGNTAEIPELLPR